jgi:hypothetical protein
MPSSLKSILNCFCATGQADDDTSRHAASHFDAPSTSALRASGALEGLAPRRSSATASPGRDDHRTSTALSDGQCQLGGYLLARHRLGETVGGPALDMLMGGNATVAATRQALRYGRGNVHDDIRDSSGESSIRTEAGRTLMNKVPSKVKIGGRKVDVSAGVRRAAGAMVAQAGSCGEHAGVATFMHAAKLGEGEEVHCVGSNQLDHSWAELHGAGSSRGQHVVMDPWGKGPAIFAEDSAFAASEHEVEGRYHYDRATGADAHGQMQAIQQKHQRRMEKQLRREMEKLGPNFRYSQDGLFHPTPIVSVDFAYRAASRMQHGPHPDLLVQPGESSTEPFAEQVFDAELWKAPLRQEIQATETARILGASGVHEIAQAATRIADVATDLRGYPLDSHPAQYEHGYGYGYGYGHGHEDY